MTKIWLLGPGSGSWTQKCDKNMKMILIKCENNVKLCNHIIFIFCITFLYYFHIWEPRTRAQAPKRRQGQFIHIIFIFVLYFVARDPDPDPRSHIFCHIPGHTFSYYFHMLWKPRSPACPYKQSLQSEPAWRPACFPKGSWRRCVEQSNRKVKEPSTKWLKLSLVEKPQFIIWLHFLISPAQKMRWAPPAWACRDFLQSPPPI